MHPYFILKVVHDDIIVYFRITSHWNDESDSQKKNWIIWFQKLIYMVDNLPILHQRNLPTREIVCRNLMIRGIVSQEIILFGKLQNVHITKKTKKFNWFMLNILTDEKSKISFPEL